MAKEKNRNKKVSSGRSTTFHENGCVVVDDLNKAAGDLERSDIASAFVDQHFDGSFGKGTYQGSVFFEDFEKATYARQLYAIYLVAKQLFVGCQYL